MSNTETRRIAAIVARVMAEMDAPKAQAAPKAKAPKQAPQFIRDRAANRDANLKLAAALRKRGVEPTGDAWKRAKELTAKGFRADKVAQAIAQFGTRARIAQA